jgi:hypothetical protein
MAADESPSTDPAAGAVVLLQRVKELLIECRAVATQLAAASVQESQAATAERIAYGVLVGALEEGLVTTLRHAVDVLRRFSAPAGALGGRNGSRSRRRPSGRGSGSPEMVPPIWTVEAGMPRPARPCFRCGREAPIYPAPPRAWAG